MKFNYTDILLVHDILSNTVCAVEAPAHTVRPGNIVRFDGRYGVVLSRHWVGDSEDAESAYAMAKALAGDIFTLEAYGRLEEVTPNEHS